MTEINDTRRVRVSKPTPLETETENAMLSERKHLVPTRNSIDSN